MSNHHCKDITEDLFEKHDRHYQSLDEMEGLPGLETLSYPQFLEKKPTRHFQKHE